MTVRWVSDPRSHPKAFSDHQREDALTPDRAGTGWSNLLFPVLFAAWRGADYGSGILG